MAKQSDRISGSSSFVVFRSLRNKLLTLMISLSLLPLLGLAAFSYFIGSRQIAEDRIKLSLEKMAQDTADKVDIMLRQEKEQVASMASNFPIVYPSLDTRDRGRMSQLLNNYCFNHEIYDLLLILDRRGRIVASNTLDRFGVPLFPDGRNLLIGTDISAYPEEKTVFSQSQKGNASHHDWYRSRLVNALYDYQNVDVSHQYNIALSEPLRHPTTNEVIGVWLSVINWFYFQDILDSVEKDLAQLDMRTGYAFMFAKDANTIIAHKYRGERDTPEDPEVVVETAQNLYGTTLVRDHDLQNLHDAIGREERSYAYEFPRGNDKISGIAPINETTFGWIVGVGIDGADIFRPINDMISWLVAGTLLLALLVVISTFIISRGITVPLKNLINTARTIAQGNLAQRVAIRSSDEVGILGATFNDMARSLSAREDELQNLNKNLENMVRQRTSELENSNEALKKAYLDLQSTQEQLVHTEKMASLGQLVAGIAHEIKNPLNFIYGNTGFLDEYIQKLKSLLESYSELSSLSPADERKMEEMKEEINYQFIQEDLHTLIDNFAEGARRINTIVSDLRTFSRMDTDVISDIDVHSSLDMSLNLLRNQYKDRIEIHLDYQEVPKIQGYAGKLSQVFMNLLANAFHAVQDKGDVWIRTRSNNGMVEVEIEDSGTGIPSENLKRIFEPFFTTKPVGKGTGLGLSISYGIIEQHGGKISVSRASPQGTIFLVRLPIFMERPNVQ
jgi:signal transduction histidine kinase